MKKTLIIFLFSFFLLSPLKANALTFEEMKDSEIVSYFEKRLNFDNFAILQDTSKYYFCPLFGTEKIIIKEYNGLNMTTLNSDNIERQLVCYSVFKSVNNPSLNYELTHTLVFGNKFTKKEDIYISSLDILNTIDNSIHFAKNYDYIKENNSDENNSFELPFTREEFLLIPFFISLLICMLFLKWCFPMKGGKKI